MFRTTCEGVCRELVAWGEDPEDWRWRPCSDWPHDYRLVSHPAADGATWPWAGARGPCYDPVRSASECGSSEVKGGAGVLVGPGGVGARRAREGLDNLNELIRESG